ncbi:glycoside hydrolase family 38 C-terminal domain-containing protein [Lentimicrobium sp. S6]|uniref:glycoside hydrolase family 38 N-terminal domain-containing protein n=1 Tax=Lentimicrobium sp. S6 TaxID=2735872 RepID=UPI001555576D|nr:glycoside hydrolase family 38 C-terminal domain-containing protein [Lentimicrobium sp. S6]NPD48147.1 hypothetical protein [Lentimicrobium sp. S6]
MNSNMRAIFFIASFFLINTIGAQESNIKYLQGFQKESSGKRFTYHSPIPNIKAALLLRGQADYKPIIWETESIPEKYTEDYVYFLLAFGRDVTGKPVQFYLSVNNKRYFSFQSDRTSETEIQKVQGINGSELVFNITMLDKFKDQMGFMSLKIPINDLKKGKAAQIKIEAEPNENPAWFMVYKTPIEESINIIQNKVVLRGNPDPLYSLSFDMMHIGKDTPVSIKIGDEKIQSELKFGYNKIDFVLPKVDDKTEMMAYIRKGNEKLIEKTFTLSPIREWEIYLVQHTHTDIGYTRPQPEILSEHLRYIDHALDYCDLTDDYPEESKFRWTCETSWSVREYLKNRPQKQIDRLVQRLKEGRMEATGMFFNFSELIDESALAAQTKTLRMLKNAGIDVTTAMQNDVNGIAWCMVDYYHDTDVKYLTMGIHAHRARKPFDKPTTFWWQSPAGNRLLAYRSEHYQHANSLGLHTGQQDAFRDNLSNYLSNLEQKGYPYDKVSLQFSGYVTDNSPPNVEVCDIIKEWNEKYEWPKLRASLAKDFMIYIDEHHGEEIEEKEVAWPDWWTDGVASAAKETQLARKIHVDIAANTALLSMSRIMGSDLPKNTNDRINEVYDNLLFYDEHTFGAAESVSDPKAHNTINQWGVKSSYVWDAWKKTASLKEQAWTLFESHIETSKLPSIVVANTLNWRRSGMIDLFIENSIISEGQDFVILNEKGEELEVREYDRRQEGAYYHIWVDDIPEMGFKTFIIHTGVKSSLQDKRNSTVFENEFYKLQLDSDKGLVNSIFDKELQLELVDTADTFGLGQVIYEQLDNRHELERLTASNRDTVYKPIGLKRSLLTNVSLEKQENGPIYKSLFLHGDLPICSDERGVDIEIRLYHQEKKIEFLYRMFKLPVINPEGVYVAFPFKLEEGELFYEAQGGIVSPGKNQLEGSSSDWNAIQNFAGVRNPSTQIVFTSNDMPLVQFGDLNIGHYYYRLKPKTNHIYSWVLNNYWVTNFKAEQQGELRWSYAITSSKHHSIENATTFGWGHRVPLQARVIWPKPKGSTSKAYSKSIINLNVANLLLVNTSPSIDDKGIILHIRELGGKHTHLNIDSLLNQTGAISASQVNVLEEKMKDLNGEIHMDHFETIFIKLEF